MKLYHGTNQDIETIDITRGLQYKDFGKGFYVTPDMKTAIRVNQLVEVVMVATLLAVFYIV